MEKQYYTPSLKEFNQGFRYEHYIPIQEAWVKEIFFLNDSHINIVKYVDIQTEDTLLKVRIKYLDHSDLIEAGWKFAGENKQGDFKYTNIAEDELWFNKKQEPVVIYKQGSICFEGKIANYNKLLDVMEMLKIRNTI